MKRILVPIDFTSYSDNAVKMAAYFAKKKNMGVKLLHVIEEKGKGNLPFQKSKKEDEYMPEMIQAAEDQMRKLLACEVPDEVVKEYEVRQTNISVSKEIVSEECDLIIMGRRRPENRESMWAGSVAEKVVRLSAMPVITVGELPETFEIKNIAFASDFSEKDNLQPVLQRVYDLAGIFNADLHYVYVQLNREFLNVKDSERKIKDKIKDFDLGRYDLNIFVAETEEEGITEYIEEYGCDLLVMVTHGRTGMATYFKQSIAENMAAYGSVPVLTYNINKDKIDRSTQPITRERTTIRTRESIR